MWSTHCTSWLCEVQTVCCGHVKYTLYNVVMWSTHCMPWSCEEHIVCRGHVKHTLYIKHSWLCIGQTNIVYGMNFVHAWYALFAKIQYVDLKLSRPQASVLWRGHARENQSKSCRLNYKKSSNIIIDFDNFSSETGNNKLWNSSELLKTKNI